MTFRGGGTYFESLGTALVPDLGGLVAFPGNCSHGGMPITRGRRCILACFLYIHHADEEGEGGGASGEAGAAL